MDKKLLYSTALLFSLLVNSINGPQAAAAYYGKVSTDQEQLEQVRTIFKSLEERRLSLLEEGTVPVNDDEKELYFSEIEFITKEGTAAAEKDYKSKVEITYNENLNKSAVSILRWDDQKRNWENSLRELSIYSQNGMLKELVYERWQTEKTQWNSIARETFAYDKSDNLTQSDWQQIVSNGQTVNLAREVFHYNSDGYLGEQVRQQWNNNDKTWANIEKTIFAYDQDGYEIEKKLQTAAGKKDWQNSRRMQYEYSEDMETKQTQVVTVFQKWQNNFWITESRELAINDDIAMETNNIAQNWNNDAAAWENNFRTVKKYTKSGILNELENYYWNEESQAWENATRILNIYDEANRLTEIIDQQWTSNNSGTENGSQGWVSSANARIGYAEQTAGRMDP